MPNDLIKKEVNPLDLPNPFAEILTQEGIDLKYLGEKLLEELEYEQPMFVEERTAGEDGVEIVTKREVKVLTPSAMKIRQAARMDAQSIFDVYPVEKKDLNKFGNVQIQIINYNVEEPKKIEE